MTNSLNPLIVPSFYSDVPDEEDWSVCPLCNKRPAKWTFDNGNHAKCECGSLYSGGEVTAETINDYFKRVGTVDYKYFQLLRLTWNRRCEEATKLKFLKELT